LQTTVAPRDTDGALEVSEVALEAAAGGATTHIFAVPGWGTVAVAHLGLSVGLTMSQGLPLLLSRGVYPMSGVVAPPGSGVVPPPRGVGAPGVCATCVRTRGAKATRGVVGQTRCWATGARHLAADSAGLLGGATGVPQEIIRFTCCGVWDRQEVAAVGACTVLQCRVGTLSL